MPDGFEPSLRLWSVLFYLREGESVMSCSSPFSIKTEQSPESFINEVKKNFEEKMLN